MPKTLEQMIAEQERKDASAPPPKKADVLKEHAWLAGYAKKKPIRNFGGNFWGINRNRCSIIKPNMIKALAAANLIAMNGTGEFTVIPPAK